VSSFQPSTLLAVQAADERLALGALWGWTVEPVGAVAEAVASAFAAVHPFVSSVTLALVTQVQEAGLAIRVWTVNSPDDLRAMAGLGVDAVITDRLVEAIDVVRGGDSA
jgi:glycerophosphoryl diester phosphodiesterase